MTTDKRVNTVYKRTIDSLHIGEIMLSEEYYNDVIAGKYKGVKAIDEPAELIFNAEGELLTKIKE